MSMRIRLLVSLCGCLAIARPSMAADDPPAGKKDDMPRVFMVSASSRQQKDRRNFILELREDGSVLRDRQQFGTWKQDRTRFAISCGEESQGTATFTTRARGPWLGSQVEKDGTRWVWEMQPVFIVSAWEHQAGNGRPRVIQFWSNGRIGEPDGRTTWTVDGVKLVLRWPAGWVDRCTLSSDGRRYEGRNQNGTLITGKLVESTK